MKSKAFECYEQSAKQYYPRGLFKTGRCYDFGIGVTQNTAQAITYYESAIEHGFVEAFVNLGKCYEIGDGVEENIRQGY